MPGKVKVLRFFKLVGRSCQRSTTIEDTDCFPMLLLVHGFLCSFDEGRGRRPSYVASNEREKGASSREVSGTCLLRIIFLIYPKEREMD